jgi:hypothetical protein
VLEVDGLGGDAGEHQGESVLDASAILGKGQCEGGILRCDVQMGGAAVRYMMLITEWFSTQGRVRTAPSGGVDMAADITLRWGLCDQAHGVGFGDEIWHGFEDGFRHFGPPRALVDGA